MTLISITTKVLNSDNYNERKVLASDINQIKGALQSGTYDIKPDDIHMEGNVITADAGQNWIRRNNNTFEYYDGAWKTPASEATGSFVAGEDLAIRDMVYVNTTDGKVYKCDADDSSKTDWIGSVQAATTTGNTATISLNGSVVGGFSGLTPGEWYGLSSTAGEIIATDNYSVGVALSATQIKLIKPKSETNIINNIYYAILYGRMENDKAGNTQLNDCITSDIFTDCNGCYDTVCNVDATSVYDSTKCAYTNYCTNNFCYNTNYQIDCWSDKCCCIDRIYHRIEADNTCLYATVGYPNWTCFYLQCMGASTICNSGNMCICDYECVEINLELINCIKVGYTSSNSNTTFGCAISCTCVNFFNDTYDISQNCYCCGNSVGTYLYQCCCEINNNYVFKKISDNCYNYYCNDNYMCDVLGTIDFTYNYKNYIFAFDGSLYGNTSYGHACPLSCIGIKTTRYSINDWNFPTNIKTHNTTKSKVYFVTYSTIPTGTCITADIYNQADCLYACDVNPEEVTALCASDSCCFYAKIKQNKGTSVEKIETTQYALLFE